MEVIKKLTDPIIEVCISVENQNCKRFFDHQVTEKKSSQTVVFQHKVMFMKWEFTLNICLSLKQNRLSAFD